MRSSFFSALSALMVAALVACSANDDDANTDTGALEASSEVCTGTFRWLQKDAYLGHAGRHLPFFPPHTATELIVECRANAAGEPAERVATIRHGNHGSDPEKRDESGTPMFDEVRTQAVTATRAQLVALADEMEGCDCDGPDGTIALSTNSKEGGVLAALEDGLAQELGCGPLVEELRSSKPNPFKMAAELIKQCRPRPPATVSSMFDDALQRDVEAHHGFFEEFHVCNNDAEVQGALFDEFVRTGVVPRCDSTVRYCRGPKLQFNANKFNP